MKTSAGKTILIVVALIALWLTVSWIRYFHDNISTRKELQNLADPVQVAKACSLMLSSVGSNAFGNIAGDDQSIPLVLRDLKARHLIFMERELRLEFHGGAEHYGLAFVPVDTDCLTGKWTLVYYDGRKRQTLVVIEWPNYGQPAR